MAAARGLPFHQWREDVHASLEFASHFRVHMVTASLLQKRRHGNLVQTRGAAIKHRVELCSGRVSMAGNGLKSQVFSSAARSMLEDMRCKD